MYKIKTSILFKGSKQAEANCSVQVSKFGLFQMIVPKSPEFGQKNL